MSPTRSTISRRAFLQAALGLAAGAAAATVPLAGCSRPEYAAPGYTPALFNAKELAVLDAASARLLPAGPGRVGARDVGVAEALDRLFADANPRLKADLKQLLNAFEDQTWLALRFRPFTAMAPAEQDRYFQAWLDSGLGQMRQAAMALNKLTATAFYMSPAAWPQIGYPGPWIGRYDFGQGLDQQGDMAKPINPHVFTRFPA